MSAAAVAAGIQVVSAMTSIVGGGKAARASRIAGRRRRAAAMFEAAQLNQMAGQSIAASQRDAIEERRRVDHMASRALALAAASGGGASDTTVVKIISDLKGEGAYRSAVALYRGEEQARRLRMGAVAKELEGNIAARGGEEQASAYETQALASAINTGASLFGRYGGGFSGSGVSEMVPGQFSTVNPAYG